MKSWFLSALALACFAPAVAADTVTMQLIGPPPGPSMGGTYTSPYEATINGVPTQVICDDFAGDVTPTTPPWQAGVTDLAALMGGSSTVKFDVGNPSQQASDYTVAAYLAMELINVDQSTLAGQTLAGQLSYALWGVFDGTDPNGPFLGGFLSGTDLTMAQNDLASAQAFVASNNLNPGNFAAQTGFDVTIYTPAPLSQNGSTPQEFLALNDPPVTAPEPPAPALFAVDLLGLVSLMLVLRRRIRQPIGCLRARS